MSQDLWHDEITSLIFQLNEEIEGGFVGLDEELYTVRSSKSKMVNGKEIYPVVDFFFTTPPLNEELRTMKVLEAKQQFFKIIDNISDAEDADDLKEAVEIHVSCLKDYTASNNKRNENNCYIVNVEGSSFPMMVYFEEDEISTKLTKITAGDLMAELKALAGETEAE